MQSWLFFPEDGNGYLKSIGNLVEGLRAENYRILYVVNGQIDDVFAQGLVGEKDLLLRRLNIGRDFGAYQAGVQFLTNEKNPNEIDSVIFANDTLYYFQSPKDIISFLSLQTWGCLYLNLENHTHAQSFLFSFSGQALRNKNLRSFWNRYVPSDFRRHTIHNGEIKLSSTLLRAGFVCRPFIDQNYIKKQVGIVKSLSPEVLNVVSNYPIGSLMGENRYDFETRKYQPKQPFRADYLEQKINPSHPLEQQLNEFVYSDPPHRIGPHLALLAGVPLKKDLYKFFKLQTLEKLEEDIPAAQEIHFLDDQIRRVQKFMIGDHRGKASRWRGEV